MIYFIQEGKSGPIKIGFTINNIKSRLADLQVGNSRKLYVRAYFDGDKYDEKELHYVFGKYRLNGEWFTPAPEILKFIISKTPAPPELSENKKSNSVDEMLDNYEKDVISRMLNSCGGNKAKTARILNISLRSLRYRLEKYDIKYSRF